MVRIGLPPAFVEESLSDQFGQKTTKTLCLIRGSGGKSGWLVGLIGA